MALTYEREKTSKEKSKYKSSEDAYVLKGEKETLRSHTQRVQTSS